MGIVTTMDLGFGFVKERAYIRISRHGVEHNGVAKYLWAEVEVWPSKEARDAKILRDYVDTHAWADDDLAAINKLFLGTAIDPRPYQVYIHQFRVDTVIKSVEIGEALVNNDARALIYKEIKVGDMTSLRYCPQVAAGAAELALEDDTETSDQVMARWKRKCPELSRGTISGIT